MQLMRALMRKEFRVLLRDWHGLALLFVLPAAFITIMSLAMQGAYELGGDHRQQEVKVLDLDNSEASSALIRGLADLGAFRFDVSHDPEQRDLLLKGLQERRHGVVMVIPAGFSDALQGMAGSPPDDVRLEMHHAPHLLPQIRELLELSVAGARDQALLAAALERLAPRFGPGSRAEAILDAPPIGIETQTVYRDGETGIIPNAVQQSVPAWLVLGMYFVVSPLAASLIVEREQGTMARLGQLNVAPGMVLGARLPTYYLLNMAQLILMLMVGIFLVPLLGGERLALGESMAGLWLIGSANSLAAICFALLVATVSRTVVQATLIGGVVTLIMAAIGGILVPKPVMPPAMQELANISPMSWGLEGFWDIILHRDPWWSVLPESLALVTFGFLCLALAALFHRHRVNPSAH